VYASEALTSGHNLQRFDCGNEVMNNWLRNSSLNVEAQRTSRTFVLCDAGSVIGYYSLAAHAIESEGLPRKFRGNARSAIPAVLLAKLALDGRYQGQGLGGALLADALGRAVRAGREVGARIMIVDAIDDEAAAFYTKHGFHPIPESNRLLRKMSDIEADLEE
jgi:GNAT superfamily N-acetyltransferase